MGKSHQQQHHRQWRWKGASTLWTALVLLLIASSAFVAVVSAADAEDGSLTKLGNKKTVLYQGVEDTGDLNPEQLKEYVKRKDEEVLEKYAQDRPKGNKPPTTVAMNIGGKTYISTSVQDPPKPGIPNRQEDTTKALEEMAAECGQGHRTGGKCGEQGVVDLYLSKGGKIEDLKGKAKSAAYGKEDAGDGRGFKPGCGDPDSPGCGKFLEKLGIQDCVTTHTRRDLGAGLWRRALKGSEECKKTHANMVAKNVKSFFDSKKLNADGTLNIKATLAEAKKKNPNAIGTVNKSVIEAARGNSGQATRWPTVDTPKKKDIKPAKKWPTVQTGGTESNSGTSKKSQQKSNSQYSPLTSKQTKPARKWPTVQTGTTSNSKKWQWPKLQSKSKVDGQVSSGNKPKSSKSSPFSWPSKKSDSTTSSSSSQRVKSSSSSSGWFPKKSSRGGR